MCKESVASGPRSVQSADAESVPWLTWTHHKKHTWALFQSWQPGHCPSFDVWKIHDACLSEDQTNSIFLQQADSIQTLGADGHFLFSSLDTDHDLYLSPEEFKPIAEKLTGMLLLLLLLWVLHMSPTCFFFFAFQRNHTHSRFWGGRDKWIQQRDNYSGIQNAASAPGLHDEKQGWISRGMLSVLGLSWC